MRRAHRKAHILLWLVITPTLAALLFAALTARTAVPANDTLPVTPPTETPR